MRPSRTAIFFLQEQGVTRFDVINFISHGVSKIGADDDDDGGEPDGKDRRRGRGRRA